MYSIRLKHGPVISYHEFIIRKQHAYDFDQQALELIKSYMSERKQITKLGVHYCYWKETLPEDPQGSILGPLLFNIFLCNLLLRHTLLVIQMVIHHTQNMTV